MEQAPAAVAPKVMAPARRSGADWLYTGGVQLLMAATAPAVVASFARL